MTDVPYLIEAVLLLLVAFVAGCYLGARLRRLASRRSAPAASPAERQPRLAEAPAPAIEAPAAPAASPALAASEDERKAEEPTPAARTPAGPRPAALAAPRNGVKDDLKRIKGIGPRIEASLNDLGIFHFSQIARWTKKNVAWLDAHLSFRGRIAREKWVEQAKALSKR